MKNTLGGHMAKNINTFLQQNLGKLLKDNGMSYSQLADKAGISIDTVKKIFRNKTNETAYVPSGNTLESIAGVFHLTPEMLLQPSISQLMDNVEVAKDSIRNNMFKESIQEADDATRFRIAMVEGGYNTIAPVIDYLQYSGYAISFIYGEPDDPSNKAIDKAKRDVRSLLREYRQKIVDNRKRISQYQNQIRELESKLIKVDSETEEIQLRKEIYDLEQALTVYEIENIEKEFQLNSLIELNKQQHANYSSLAELIAGRRIEVKDAIKVINKLDTQSTRLRNESLEKLQITILMKRMDGFGDEPKKMSIADFYHLCERIKQFIDGQIQ